MNERPNRPALIAVALLLVGGALVVPFVFLGGQTSQILSTVGGAITTGGNGQGGSGDTTGQDPGNGGDDGAGAGSGGQVADAAATVPSLLIIRTGKLGLEVVDLDVAVRTGEAAVIQAGGYVSASARATTDDRATAAVTYRIPSSRWDATLDALHRLAAKVDSEQISTEEVTGQVVDLTARIANLRASEAALQAIMTKAAKISDVLDVQRQLTTTRGEIEQLVGQKARLVDQASFGSLDVTYHLPAVPAPAVTPAPVPGWDPGTDIARASDKLVRIGQSATTAGIWISIVGLPVLLGGLVLTFVGWQLYRLGRWILRQRDVELARRA